MIEEDGVTMRPWPTPYRRGLGYWPVVDPPAATAKGREPSRFDLVRWDDYGRPECVEHGAMNKVTPSPPGIWRCLQGIVSCRAACQETENRVLGDPEATP